MLHLLIGLRSRRHARMSLIGQCFRREDTAEKLQHILSANIRVQLR